MGFELSGQTSELGYRVKEFDTIGSTNAQALSEAQDGETDLIWYVTKDQRSGRGRRGREWSTQQGNLAATLLLVHDYPLEVAATLSFVAGLSLIEAIGTLLPNTPTQFRLKWPNDILADNAKLSGILLESAFLKTGRKVLVIGIGVNVLHVPEGVPYAVTSLHQEGYTKDAEHVLTALAGCFAANYNLWNNGLGMPVIRDRWLQHAARLGDVIRVQSGGEMLEGVFTSIDDEGRLILSMPQGRRHVITAGEVFFGALSQTQ